MTAKQNALTLFIIIVVFCTLFIFNQIGEVNANPTHLEPYRAYPAPNTSTPAQTSTAANAPTKTSTGTTTRTPTKTSTPSNTPIKSPTTNVTRTLTKTPTKSATPASTFTGTITSTVVPTTRSGRYNQIFLPGVFSAPTVSIPPIAKSYYIRWIYWVPDDNGKNQSTLYYMGCQQGLEAMNTPDTQKYIVFLHFNEADNFIGKDDGRSYYGAFLYDGKEYATYKPASDYDIHRAALDFGHGFYRCSGADLNSKVTIVLSINNNITDSFNYFHGLAWGEEIFRLNRMIYGTYNNQCDPDYCSWSRQIIFAGGGDFEINVNTTDSAKSWIDGFAAGVTDPLTGEQYNNVFYNFGDASGCPIVDTAEPGDCTNNRFTWSQNDINYISSCDDVGGICQVIPEIYYPVLAKQWYQLSRVKYQQSNVKLPLRGVMSDYYSECVITSLGEPPNPMPANCDSSKPDPVLSPALSYETMFDLLAQNPQLAENSDELKFLTEICWMQSNWPPSKTSDFCK